LSPTFARRAEDGNVRSPDLQDLVGRIEVLAEKVGALRRFL
jgi:hypothetical protein